MKKIIVAILAIVYISTSTGAVVHLHYCMGKLSGWSLFTEPGNICGKCGMKKTSLHKGCCKDEHKQVKLEKDQQTSEQGLLFVKLFCPAIPSNYLQTTERLLLPAKGIIPLCQSPPRTLPVPVYLLNCVFRI